MKLYNIYESIILEEAALITEDGNRQDIIDAINGKYEVWLKYRDKKGGVTDRYVQIYKIGTSRGGNEMISVWQKGGQSAVTKKENTNAGWKQFLVNNIVVGSITPTKMKFHKPVSDLASFGNGGSYKHVGKDGPNRQFDIEPGQANKVNFNK